MDCNGMKSADQTHGEFTIHVGAVSGDVLTAVSEIHRYFPDWADLPSGPDPLREADRNSYLAGGYADEFGYGRHSNWPPAIPPLDGEPDGSKLCHEQIGALHPGYPQCPKPVDRMSGSDSESECLASARIAGAHKLSTESFQPPGSFVGYRVLPVRSRGQTALFHFVFRVGPLAFVAERLLRRRHLNDVL